MKQHLALFLVLLHCVCQACHTTHGRSEADSTVVAKVKDGRIDVLPVVDSMVVQSQKDTTLIRDQFILNALEVIENHIMVDSLYSGKKHLVTTRRNEHKVNEIDSIFYIRTPLDSLVYYKSPSKTIPKHLKIRSKKLPITSSIQIGMSYASFREQMNIDNKYSEVVVEDLEGGNTFTFLFENDLLYEIHYNINYLD